MTSATTQKFISYFDDRTGELELTSKTTVSLDRVLIISVYIVIHCRCGDYFDTQIEEGLLFQPRAILAHQQTHRERWQHLDLHQYATLHAWWSIVHKFCVGVEVENWPFCQNYANTSQGVDLLRILNSVPRIWLFFHSDLSCRSWPKNLLTTKLCECGAGSLTWRSTTKV